MTDRLSALLHDEADRLAVPPPAAADVLRQGHGLRRRHRLTRGAAAVAVLAVVAGGGVFLVDRAGDGSARVVDPSVTAAQAYAAGGAYSVGSDIHLGVGDDHVVSVDGKVKSMYYTSAGLVVRTGPSAATDSAGASRYALVTPEGEVRDLGIDLGDRVPATEPGAPYLAWATAGDGDRSWQVVVMDVRSATEVARVDVTGTFTWGGWEAPPVGLSGDTVYVGFDEVTTEVDWPSGDTTDSQELSGGSVGVDGGIGVVSDTGRHQVLAVDLATGQAVLRIPDTGYPVIDVSPDGRFAKVIVQEDESSPTGESSSLHDLATGDHEALDQPAWDYGWTPDGHLLKVTRTRVTVCVPVPFRCTVTPADLGEGPIKVAGRSYES